jgi:hypothetical protein
MDTATHVPKATKPSSHANVVADQFGETSTNHLDNETRMQEHATQAAELEKQHLEEMLAANVARRKDLEERIRQRDAQRAEKRKRKEEEAAESKKREQEEAERIREVEEAKSKREQEEAEKREAEEAKSKREQEEAEKREAEEAKRKREEEEAEKREAEEAKRKREAEEAKSKREAEEAKRKREAEEVKRKREAEKREAEEAKRKREAEEAKRKRGREQAEKKRELEELGKKREAEKKRSEGEQKAEKRRHDAEKKAELGPVLANKGGVPNGGSDAAERQAREDREREAIRKRTQRVSEENRKATQGRGQSVPGKGQDAKRAATEPGSLGAEQQTNKGKRKASSEPDRVPMEKVCTSCDQRGELCKWTKAAKCTRCVRYKRECVVEKEPSIKRARFSGWNGDENTIHPRGWVLEAGEYVDEKDDRSLQGGVWQIKDAFDDFVDTTVKETAQFQKTLVEGLREVNGSMQTLVGDLQKNEQRDAIMMNMADIVTDYTEFSRHKDEAQAQFYNDVVQHYSHGQDKVLDRLEHIADVLQSIATPLADMSQTQKELVEVLKEGLNVRKSEGKNDRVGEVQAIIEISDE